MRPPTTEFIDRLAICEVPTEGKDVPGHDYPDVPRHPNSWRIFLEGGVNDAVYAAAYRNDCGVERAFNFMKDGMAKSDWTPVAVDPGSRLLIFSKVGKRGTRLAEIFIQPAKAGRSVVSIVVQKISN